MFARQTLALAFAGVALVGCGASAVPGAAALSGANPNSVLQALALAPKGSTPKIKSVSKIKAQQTQKIVIKGKGFGTMQAYDGDSCCIEFVVTNPQCENYGSYDTWQAGYESSNPNLVTLNVKKWTNKEILITGFTGDYGQGCWTLNSGEPIQVNVWNAQTQSGPATWSGTIQ
jgi:hypothetical protein